jgi:hypothetical protein
MYALKSLFQFNIDPFNIISNSHELKTNIITFLKPCSYYNKSVYYCHDLRGLCVTYIRGFDWMYYNLIHTNWDYKAIQRYF